VERGVSGAGVRGGAETSPKVDLFPGQYIFNHEFDTTCKMIQTYEVLYSKYPTRTSKYLNRCSF
jgi:hypothetical protein